MSFNPLAAFNPDAAPIPSIVAAARKFYDVLPIVPAGDLTRLYLHWSCESMTSLAPAYNVVVTESNGHFAISVAHDLRDNARSTFNAEGYAAHTYHRNTGGIGLALDGMDGSSVSPFSFGSDGVTVMGLTWLCAAAGALALRYGIDVSGLSLDSDPFYGEVATLTHGEAADLPGTPAAYEPYGPTTTMERWDLTLFRPIKPGMVITSEMAQTCGDALRQLAHTYKVALERG